jgi:hypothetical protein
VAGVGAGGQAKAVAAGGRRVTVGGGDRRLVESGLHWAKAGDGGQSRVTPVVAAGADVGGRPKAAGASQRQVTAVGVRRHRAVTPGPSGGNCAAKQQWAGGSRM